MVDRIRHLSNAISTVAALALILIGFCLALPVISTNALAQAQTAQPVTVPGFWDPRRRPERPDLSRITLVRFLTESDYPPFHFVGPDGNPSGFNVDLARL